MNTKPPFRALAAPPDSCPIWDPLDFRRTGQHYPRGMRRARIVARRSGSAKYAARFLVLDDESARPIQERILEIVAESSGWGGEHLTMESRFDVLFDSLDMGELIMELEQTFNVAFPAEDAVNIKTVRDLVDYVLRRGL